MTSQLINLDRIGFTPGEIKTTISYLAIDPKVNKELIQKFMKLARYIKNSDE